MLSFADKDAGALWNELKLSQLVSDNPNPEDILPLALQSQLGMRRSKEKLLLEHTKQWKKPSYNVLKDRYASKPHEPPVLDASKLKTLADPLRGKYASYDKLMSEDEDDGDEQSKRLGNTLSTGRPHRYNNSSNEYSGTPSSEATKSTRDRPRRGGFAVRRLPPPRRRGRERSSRSSSQPWRSCRVPPFGSRSPPAGDPRGR